jgi:hypothetical protein
MPISVTQDGTLSNLLESERISSRPGTKAGDLLPLAERLQRLDACNFDLITATLNDELIQQGRAYSCEQAYPIRAKFGAADHEIAKMLEGEFRKFVALTLIEPGRMHAPSGAVDMYWHYFILHTDLYAEFCEKVWGDTNGNPALRNHYPATDETRPAMRDAYQHTRELYEKVFGAPQPYCRKDNQMVDVWPGDEVTCGDSYSGTECPGSRMALWPG